MAASSPRHRSMSHRVRIFVLLAIALAILVPVTVAQKPPAPAPVPAPPPSTTPRGPTTPFPSTSSDPTQSRDDLVMFLRGRIATHDGSAIPHDVLVERVCGTRVRQVVYASLNGDFSMQLGSRTDSFPEASPDSVSPYGALNRDFSMGIPRHELMNCELHASASGFHSRAIPLMDL